MATCFLDPVSDGTTGGWTGTSGSNASNIDDYDNGGLDNGAHDSDTTRANSPNKADGSLFVTLQSTPADFDPNAISAVRVKWAARIVQSGISGGADTVDGYVQVFKSDESTAMTDEQGRLAIDNGFAGNEWTETMTPSGTFTQADWDGARLRIRNDYTQVDTADTNAWLGVSAARVEIDYTPLAPDPATETLLVVRSGVIFR